MILESSAFNDRLSTASYLIASQASEVWVHPLEVACEASKCAYQELYEKLKLNTTITLKVTLNPRLSQTQEQICQKMTGCESLA